MSSRRSSPPPDAAPRFAAAFRPATSFVPRFAGLDVLLLLLVVAGGAALLIALVLWFDNAQGGLTGNGVFKSLELKPWVVDPAHAPLYPANYLFYPVYGALCRLLDLVGVFAGDPRRQLTILNAAMGGLCAGIAFLLARRLAGDRRIALTVVLFHLATAHVMFLAIVNEDIMPGYTAMFGAMALAAVWFARPTAPRVAGVAILFSLAWLFEWRLMFPTLPALLAALWLCEPRKAVALLRLAQFAAIVLACAAMAALATMGHPGAAGPFELVWTGKAVRSVWAGFTWAKVGYLWDGIVAYLVGTGIATFDHLPGWDLWRFATTALLLALGGIAGTMLWRARADAGARALATVFGVTFVAGSVFNLYSQPQDPQMQVNVMAWVTPAFLLVLVAVARRGTADLAASGKGRGLAALDNGRGLAAMTALVVALAAYNVWSLAPLRGLDTRWREAIGRLEAAGDPARTVFLLHDFDWTMVYGALHWGPSEPGTATLGPAPQERPRFKWIGFTGDTLRHPDWSTPRLVDSLRAQIDRALELGYAVLVVRLWDLPGPQLLTETGMVADAGRLGALTTMLHADFVATPLYTDPVAGPVLRLQRAPGR